MAHEPSGGTYGWVAGAKSPVPEGRALDSSGNGIATATRRSMAMVERAGIPDDRAARVEPTQFEPVGRPIAEGKDETA